MAKPTAKRPTGASAARSAAKKKNGPKRPAARKKKTPVRSAPVIKKKVAVKKVSPRKTSPKRKQVRPRSGGPTIVRVGQPSRSSFDPNRDLDRNLLLKNQILHFYQLDQEFEEPTGIKLESIQTEGQAAGYIRQVMFRLHPEGADQEDESHEDQ